MPIQPRVESAPEVWHHGFAAHLGPASTLARDGTTAASRYQMDYLFASPALAERLTRAKARLARTATPTSSFSVPVPA
jgi:predicted RNA polymerase sigma factor